MLRKHLVYNTCPQGSLKIIRSRSQMSEAIINPSETIHPETGTRLCTRAMVSLVTGVGGPLAGAFLMSHNYRVFGKAELARKTLIYGIIATFVLCGGIFLVPAEIMDAVPNSVIPGAYTAAIYVLFQQLQFAAVEEKIKAGMSKYSYWKATMVALGSALILMTLIVGPAVFTESSLENQNLKEYKLARSYYTGKGVKQDYAKAIEHDTIAANKGFAPSQFDLGLMSASGVGVPVDLVLAAKWMQLAAAQHFPPAEYVLGRMYLEGQGHKKDKKKGMQLIREAATHDDKQAKDFLETNQN